ncbi:MAG: hypothetical protein M1835_004092 [Candelina submexicana]|nr:MAG: hypothetical protein M1835_004092 [Candelina submexicana]
MAQVVYSNTIEGANLDGGLFEGKKFWFSRRVPMRNHYIEQVKSNGGLEVPLEKQADILIVDHMRKDVAPGTHSWTYINQSVKKGALEDLQDHVAGPPAGTLRNAGSTTRPASGIRKSYTTEDDRVLYEWVTTCRDKGDKILGNEIYKQLEAINPRHPWQSWRDRWVKQLSHRPPPASRSESLPPSPTSEEQPNGHLGSTRATPLRNSHQARSPSYPRVELVVKRLNFTEEDVKLLLDMAGDVEKIQPDRCEEAWGAFADKYPDHSAQEWETFFQERVLPIHQAKSKKMKAKAAARNAVSSGRSPVPSPKAKRSANAVPPLASSPLKGRIGIGRDSASTQVVNSPTFTPDSPTSPTHVRQRSGGLDRAPLTPSQPRYKGNRTPTEAVTSSHLHRTLFVSNEEDQSPPSSHTKNNKSTGKRITIDQLERSTTATGVHIESKSETARFQTENPGNYSEAEVKLTEQSPGYIREQNHLLSLPRYTSRTTSPQMRKRLAMKGETEGSPMKQKTPHSSKRQRLQVDLKGDLEIPSTPDKDPSSVPQYTPTPNRTVNQGWDPDQEDGQSDVELGMAVSETLSEPDQPPLDTQFILHNPIEEPDFDLPEPPGGWDEGDLRSEYDDNLVHEPEPNRHMKDTQAILDAATQFPDFTVPDPDGGWETILPSSPPAMPTSSHAAPPPSAEDINARLDAWIDSRVTAGISEDDVLLALKSATMHTGLAEIVLKSLIKGKGLPRDVRGIWTSEDDRNLESSDGRLLMALERKHGKDTFDARWMFLEDYRGVGG